MENIVKIIGIGLIGAFISIILKQYKSEFALPVTLITGIIIFFMVSDKLAGIVNLISNISNKTGINGEFLGLLLKITGIAILMEFAINICKDSNENAISTKIEFGGKIIMISLSIPIISALLELTLDVMP